MNKSPSIPFNGQIRFFWKHLNQVLSRGRSRSVLRRRAIGSQWYCHSAQIEQLEQRALLSATAVANSTNLLHTLNAEPTVQFERSAATAAATFGYTPSQMQTAYGVDHVSFISGGNGAGQTIAIVDAYNAPTIQSDLQAFDSAYGLSNPPSLTVMSQTGSTTSLPTADPSQSKSSDWEVEESLDVEWAHALAPAAKIVLVEANSSSFSDLLTAVTTAAALPGVSVVSMSWGGSEFSSEAAYNSTFATPAGHQGVTFVASTGDSGVPGGFPAFSPNVLAVGGTSLTIGSSGNYVSESGWSGSGGGISQYETQPTYQHGVVTQSTTNRTIPDVAFDADPNTGVGVYDTYSFGTTHPWAQVGGTSLAAPEWASLIAITNQGRAQNGLATLDGSSQTIPMLYHLDQTAPTDFHDITTGNNGDPAGSGYDLVTGLGSPVFNQLVSGLGGSTTTSSISNLVFQQSPTTGTAGQALNPSVKVAIENSSGHVVTTDNSTVTLSISSGPGAFASGSTISVSAVNGIATFSNLILDVSGNYTLIAKDGSDTGGSSQVITIHAGQASKVAFQQQPAVGTAGQVLNQVKVAVEDQFGNVVTGNSSTVNVSVASGPGSFSTGCTTKVTAVNGMAIFNNLILGTGGSYTLGASDSGLNGATSTSFVIPTIALSEQILSSNSVELNWSTVTGSQGYRIYWSDGVHEFLLGIVAPGSTSVKVLGLIPGSHCQFMVEAYHGSTVQDSNWVSVTMPTH